MSVRDPVLAGAISWAERHLRFGKREGAIALWSAEKAVTLFKFYSNGVLIACQPACQRLREQAFQPVQVTGTNRPIGRVAWACRKWAVLPSFS